MADKNLRARVTGLASQALSNPVTKAARDKAFDAAKGVSGAAVTAIRNRASGDSGSAGSTDSTDSTASTDDKGSLSTAEPAGVPAEDTLDSARSDDDEETTASASGGNSAGESGGDSGGQSGAPDLLPYPHLEEPVPVVEQALEAERNGEVPVQGHATEPHASTRDEGHGDAQLQPAEQAEIAEEVAEAIPGGDLDLETPVGTTGADVGHNPDTAEADLQQPGTPPLVDDATANAVASESETLGRAADPDKG